MGTKFAKRLFIEAFLKLSLLLICACIFSGMTEYAIAKTVAYHPSHLCNSDFVWHSGNLKSAHEIDVNADSNSELLLFIQYNNNARFHLFYRTDCGYEEVTNTQGESISFLSYASSSICQPIGCIELTFCTDEKGLRYLVNISGRHTLTPQQKHQWQDGSLFDEDVTSSITITKYRLVNGTLIKADSRMVPDVRENMALFNPDSHDLIADGGVGDEAGVGFSISSCD